MSQVAKELDRHVSTLYAHVDSLADLQREVGLLGLDELADAVWRAVLGKVRGDALAAIAEVYVDYARRHPGRGVAMREADQSRSRRGRARAPPGRADLGDVPLLRRRRGPRPHRASRVQRDHPRARPRPDRDDLPQAVALFVLALESGQWPVPS